MGRLAKGPPKLGTEMGSGQTGLARQVADVERLGVPRVDEVLCAQQVAGGVRRWDWCGPIHGGRLHMPSIANRSGLGLGPQAGSDYPVEPKALFAP